MIKKLSEYKITKRDGDYINADNNTQIINTLVCKINELCDVINTIQKEREAERFEIQEWIGILEAVRKSVNVHEKQIDELQMKVEPEKCEDPYAEQRKWIGTLCRFWDGNKTPTQTTDFAYGTLLEIDDYGDFKCDTMTWFDNCEPVKPDDDIIYKGGKDE